MKRQRTVLIGPVRLRSCTDFRAQFHELVLVVGQELDHPVAEVTLHTSTGLFALVIWTKLRLSVGLLD